MPDPATVALTWAARMALDVDKKPSQDKLEDDLGKHLKGETSQAAKRGKS